MRQDNKQFKNLNTQIVCFKSSFANYCILSAIIDNHLSDLFMKKNEPPFKNTFRSDYKLVPVKKRVITE